jgi:hypothetical protein
VRKPSFASSGTSGSDLRALRISNRPPSRASPGYDFVIFPRLSR